MRYVSMQEDAYNYKTSEGRPKSLIILTLRSIVYEKTNERCRLNKVAMTDKLLKLKRELDYKCEIGEMGEWECVGAKKYLNRTFDVLDEYWQ